MNSTKYKMYDKTVRKYIVYKYYNTLQLKYLW